MSEPEPQVVAYQALRDALDAAASAGDEAVRRGHLRDAARAGRDVFVHAGTLESTVVELPSGERETFVDASAATTWTYVRAAYAGLAAGDRDVLEDLAGIDLDALHSEQVVTAPALDAVAEALRMHLGGEGARGARALLEAMGAGEDEGDRYWLAQLEAIAAVEDEAAFQAALADVEAAEREYYGEGSPEAELMLPVAGLRALAERARS